MVGRVLRVVATVIAMAVALVTPVLVTTSATPAAADTVVDGCTIVSNPTSTNYTNCPDADLAGADLHSLNLSFANFAGGDLAGALLAACPPGVDSFCNFALLSDANLSRVNLSGAVLAAATLAELRPGSTAARFDDANLTDANLTDTVLSASFPLGGLEYGTVADFTGATLTGANFTNTILVPSNQTVTATSQAGAVATWSTPAAIPGETPGSCTPASGSTFPLFSSTVTCQVLDANNDVATGTFQVNVAPTTQFFTRVLVPSDGAVLAGAPYLDAGAGDGQGVTNVVFELSGGALSDQVIATATPTYYGWLAKWNTTTVPNGTYSLQSVATDADSNTDTSTPITVTVNNQPPVTAVLIPSNGATVSGATALLDAGASSAVGIASVTFEVSGGTLSDQVVATATPTYYGWLAQWNTTAVPNGTYSLQSVATDTVAETTTSSPVSVTVDNPAPTTTVLIPSNGATQSGTAALLDASASPNVTAVTYELTGGTLTDQVVATATPTYYGWLAQWDTTTVPNGTYTLQSVAAYSGGVTGTSPGVTITVANPGLADLANSSFAFTPSVGGSGCGIVHLTFDAIYPGSAAVGNVTLHIAGCVSDPYTYAGSFTITTGVGTLSGNATGSITYIGDTLESSYQITLSVTTATGSFSGTTGNLLFSAPYQTPQVASLTVE
jgi:Bacterial Ig domain/Pentapeptide repeats (8 copies)